MLDQLKAATMSEAAMFFVVANAFIFASSVMLCWLLGRFFAARRIFDRWEPLRPVEMAAALGSIFFNAGVSLVGWCIWKAGFIVIESGGLAAGIRDCLAMLLFMDLGMYTLHRFAHRPWLFTLFHR